MDSASTSSFPEQAVPIVWKRPALLIFVLSWLNWLLFFFFDRYRTTIAQLLVVNVASETDVE